MGCARRDIHDSSDVPWSSIRGAGTTLPLTPFLMRGEGATRNLAISAPVGIDAGVLKVGTVVWYALSPVKVIRFDCRL